MLETRRRSWGAVCSMRIKRRGRKRGFIRLILVAGILWMLLILVALVWSCQSSLTFFRAICKKDSKVYVMLDAISLLPKPEHRCPIPLSSNPDKIVIPKRTTDKVVENLSYITEDEPMNSDSQSSPLFDGHQSWMHRQRSFRLFNHEGWT